MPAQHAVIQRNEDDQNFVETVAEKPSAQDTNSSIRLVRISDRRWTKASLTSCSDTLMQLMTQSGPMPGMNQKEVSTSPSQGNIRRTSSLGTSAIWSSQSHKDAENNQELTQIGHSQVDGDMEWVNSGCQSLQQGLDQGHLGQWDIRNGFDAAFDDGLSMLDNMSPIRPGYDGNSITRISEDQSQHTYGARLPGYVPESSLRISVPRTESPRSANTQTRRNKTHSMSEPAPLIDHL